MEWGPKGESVSIILSEANESCIWEQLEHNAILLNQDRKRVSGLNSSFEQKKNFKKLAEYSR